MRVSGEAQTGRRGSIAQRWGCNRRESLATGQQVYRVVSGDTLSGIARAHLGSAGRWPDIWNANKNRIADPNLIEIGWELVLPAR